MFNDLAMDGNQLPRRVFEQALDEAIAAQKKTCKFGNELVSVLRFQMGMSKAKAEDILKQASAREGNVSGVHLNEDHRKAILGWGEYNEGVQISLEAEKRMIDHALLVQPERLTWYWEFKAQGKLKPRSGR